MPRASILGVSFDVEESVVPTSRRLAVFLLAVAGWNVLTWSTFIRNLAHTEGRPTGYYVAHTVLIVVNLAIAAHIRANAGA